MSAPGGSLAGPPAEAWVKRRIARRIATNVMRLLPIQFYGYLFPRRTIGLCYHLASDLDVPHIRHLYRYKTPEQFEDDLIYLQRNFDVVPFEDLLEGRPLTRNAVVLSFDDGLRECYDVARPLLLKHGLPCIFFVSPPHLDNRRMFFFNQVSLLLEALTELGEADRLRALGSIGGLVDREFLDLPAFARWVTAWMRTLLPADEALLERMCALAEVSPDRFLAQVRPYMTTTEVKTLAAEGFTIGGHALRHVALGAFPAPVIRQEILESCEAVARITGASRIPFAFPYDANGVDRAILADLRREDPRIGPFFDTGEMLPDEDFMVNRMIVDSPGVMKGRRSNLGGYLRKMYLEAMARGGFGGSPVPR